MKLALKHSNSHWVDISKGIKFLVDYPTREQQEKLEEMESDTFGKFIRVSNSKDNEFTVDVNKHLKFKRYFCKCVIKDWEGLDRPCVLKDNELDDELWWDLVRDKEQSVALYDLLSHETEFTKTDKKK